MTTVTRRDLIRALYGPTADSEENVETLLWRVGEMRRQIEAAHERLDLLGAPRELTPGGTKFTVAGRLEQIG